MRVREPPPGGAIRAGQNQAVTPWGAPVTDNESAELKVPTGAVVTVTCPETPGSTLRAVDPRASVNVGGGLMVSGMGRDCVSVPPAAVTVNEVATVGAAADAATVSVALPEPGTILAGETVALTPCGNPFTVSLSGVSNPFCAAPQLTCRLEGTPGFRVRLPGVAARMHAGAAAMVRFRDAVWLCEPWLAAMVSG